MFNKDEKNLKETETIIGSSVKVSGAFVSKGDILIDGEFEGSLETTNNIKIGEKAIIIANITAANSNIQGQVKGDITLSEFLEVGPQATINGNIICKYISIAKGAVINGNVTMSSDNKSE